MGHFQSLPGLPTVIFLSIYTHTLATSTYLAVFPLSFLPLYMLSKFSLSCSPETILTATVEMSRPITRWSAYLHIISSAIVLSIILSHNYFLPTFATSVVIIGDKERLCGLFCKAFKRELCCHVFKSVELMMTLIQNYFARCLTIHTVYIPSCVNKDHVACSSTFRSRGHNYLLPHIEQFIRSLIDDLVQS